MADEKKRPLKYTILVIPNNGGKVKEIRLSFDFIIILTVMCIGMLLCGIGYLTSHAAELESDRLQVFAWKSRYEVTESANAILLAENQSLQSEIDKLKSQMDMKDYLEQQTTSAEATKYMPSGLPVGGQVSVPSAYSSDIEGITFTVGYGAKIVATGNGKVVSVKTDSQYGYIVTIDHGNDYISYYCYKAQPFVSEGDEVTRGQSIYLVQEDSPQLIYKITYQGNPVDPNAVMDAAG